MSEEEAGRPAGPLMENDLLNGAVLQLALGPGSNGTPGAALGD